MMRKKPSYEIGRYALNYVIYYAASSAQSLHNILPSYFHGHSALSRACSRH